MSGERSEGKPIASPDDTFTIALSLAKAGWPIFPVKLVPVTRADGTKVTDKRPLVKWLDGATTDLEQIATWWGSEHPGAWIGVHAARAGIVVVDVDADKGQTFPKGHARAGEVKGDGKANLKAAGIEPPKTFRYKTRGAGMHHVYQAPEGKRLTIAADTPVPSVDIRAGHGLMVYYGPALIGGAPELAPAPAWAVLELKTAEGNKGTARSDGDLDAWLARMPGDGKPSKPVKQAAKLFSADTDHDGMLGAVTAIVKVAGQPGARRAYEAARERYLDGRPDRARDLDNALRGSIAALGMPPMTLPTTKAERKVIAKRNEPEAVIQAKAKKVAARVAERIESGDGELTDAALAEALEAELRDWWLCLGDGDLRRYDGIIWQPASEASLVEAVRKVMRRIRAEATRLAIMRGDKRAEIDARALEQRSRIVAVARLAAGIMLERHVELDADPDVLNCPNGVVSLRTGKLRKRHASDYFTKVTGVDYVPSATSADWHEGLKALPRETRNWVQVRLGQAATGRISGDKSIPFFLGGGDNGKSVVVGAARSALGTYAVTVPERLLLGSDNDHPTDIMTLRGARLAVFEELPRGGRLNAQRIKLLAGTNELSGRLMRQDFASFRATHTLVGATNHLPLITDVDDAIWARVAPVPFPYRYVANPKPGTNQRQADEGLRDRLADTPDVAVLAWLVEGAVKSYGIRAEKPTAVTEALDEWRGEADPVLGFIRDRLEFDEGRAIAAVDFYAEFGAYLEGRNQPRWSEQLAATSFSGHSSMGEVVKRQVSFSAELMPSRPPFALKPLARRSMAWVGVKFRDEPGRIISEAEADAETVESLGKRAKR